MLQHEGIDSEIDSIFGFQKFLFSVKFEFETYDDVYEIDERNKISPLLHNACFLTCSLLYSSLF